MPRHSLRNGRGQYVAGAGAASVRVVCLPPGLPDGWDLADNLPAGLTEPDLRRLLDEAEPWTSNSESLPLFPPLPAAEPYPVEALGPVLSRATAAISRKVQVPPATAAQSILSVASLAAQAHADVLLPFGQARPLSLYLVTVVESGGRKTSSDNEALWPVRKREKELKEEHEREHQAWAIASSAWAAEKRKIEGDKTMDLKARTAALVALGPEPARPLLPLLTVPDPTVEGLAKAWVSAPGSLGLFTAEGGQWIGGHGMSADHRLKTAATFSEIWDGRPIKRVRAADGVTILDGRRLALHIMVQPDAAAQFLADQTLRDQGLLSRVLVAAPDSIAGTRFYREPRPEDEAAIRAFGARILSLLEAPWPAAGEQPNELCPRTLPMSAEATALWRAFHDHIEGQCGPGGELASIQDFAAKAPEHAARLAGVLTIVDDVRAAEIGVDAMSSGLTLADWYVVEAVRMQRAARTDPRLLRAQALLEWLQTRSEPEIDFRDVLRLGPGPVRTRQIPEWVTRSDKRTSLTIAVTLGTSASTAPGLRSPVSSGAHGFRSPRHGIRQARTRP